MELWNQCGAAQIIWREMFELILRSLTWVFYQKKHLRRLQVSSVSLLRYNQKEILKETSKVFFLRCMNLFTLSYCSLRHFIMQRCTNRFMCREFMKCLHSYTKQRCLYFTVESGLGLDPNIWFGLNQIIQRWAVFFCLLLIRTIMTSSLFPSLAFLFPTVSTLKTNRLLLF